MNRAPVRSIGRGGTCLRCGGGVKIPSAHAVDNPIEDVETGELGIGMARTDAVDLITAAIEDADPFSAAEVALYDVGRPARPARSITAPSAVVAEATVLPTASQLAASDRSERSVLPPMQIMRSLRRFSGSVRPRRHVASRRQQPGTPWWAWMAHGVLSVGAVYALSSLYHANFNTNVNALPATSIGAPIAEMADASARARAAEAAGTGDAELDALVATSPDERIWIRYERVLLPNNRQQYAVVRVTQDQNGRVRVERSESTERPGGFPENAKLVDHRGTPPIEATTDDATPAGLGAATTQPTVQ